MVIYFICMIYLTKCQFIPLNKQQVKITLAQTTN